MQKRTNAIDLHVGIRIRLRRTMLGLSQEQLGDGLGITFQQVQKYEKGTNRISASRLQHIAEILNVPIPFFFEGSPSAVPNGAEIERDSLVEMMSSKECVALATAFFAIPDQRIRQNILVLVRSLGTDPSCHPENESLSTAEHLM